VLSKVNSGALLGLNFIKVICEIDISTKGFPAYFLVGLPDNAVKESRERIISAIKNSGFEFPSNDRITINLAPADLKKEGSLYDLPIAIGILIGAEKIYPKINLDDFVFLGELSLDGSLRPVKGVLPITAGLKKYGIKNIIVPFENRFEASIVKEVNVYAFKTLKEVVDFLTGKLKKDPFKDDTKSINSLSTYNIDFKDVKGHFHAKRAITIAAAGGHNILMIGPPGSGKSMLAKRIPTILPDLTYEEMLETTKIYSIGGLLTEDTPLITKRPFRAPHHTTSSVALIGGGSSLKPGEVSLAHNGVLFLDELPEFKRGVLEVLREPLENGYVTISRARGSVRYPARFMFVAAMNPCPCGYYGDPEHTCSCSLSEIKRYRSKVSGPLLDRIDIYLDVPRVDVEKLMEDEMSESSLEMKNKVVKAREIQYFRYKRHKNILLNSHLPPNLIEKYVILSKEAKNILKMAIKKFNISNRGFHRILKLSRTIADIDNSEKVDEKHILEAIGYRTSLEL